VFKTPILLTVSLIDKDAQIRQSQGVNGLYEEFGRRVRSAREAAGLTQEAVACRVGLKRTSISNIERGEQHIPLHALWMLAAAIGVKPTELLPEEAEQAAKITPPVTALRAVENQSAEEVQPWMRKIVARAQTDQDGVGDAQSRRSSQQMHARSRHQRNPRPSGTDR
jgi:transcriptional regulator with XRE-family HTH domain